MAVVDKGWSWVVNAASFVSMFSVIGLFRSSGVIYTAIIDVFDTTREEASWPFSLASTVGLLVSVANGVLCRLFTIRTIVFSATLLSAIGVALCFGAKGSLPVTIYLGIIYGSGIGIVHMSNLIIICQYFRRYKTIATGITYAGATMGSFILPPLIEHLLDIYGLRGTFLIVSGIILQGLVAAALFRPQDLENLEVNLSSSDKLPAKVKFVSRYIHIFRSWMTVLRFRIFYLIWITYSSYHITYFSFPTVIVDYALDLNIKLNKGVFLLSSYCIADLCGRLLCGWMTDVVRIKRKYVMAVSFLIQSVILVLTPFSNGYVFLIFIAVGVGFFSGCLMTQWHLLFVDYLDLILLPLAMGTMLSLTGFISICYPFIIGYYRDIRGSYNLLFYTCSGINAFAGILWCMENFFIDSKSPT